MSTDAELWEVPAGSPVPIEDLPTDPAGEFLANWVAEQIYQRSITTSRSLIRKVGPSGLGAECAKKLAWSAAGMPRLNFGSDPWAALVGTAIHDWMADLFARLDAGSGRYLIESAVSYRGVSGTADLYDRRTGTVIDWKTTRKGKIRTIRRTAPPPGHVTQVHTYGAGFAEAGESPERVALVFLPVDGKLTDVHAWVTDFDRSIADRAIDRMEALRRSPLDAVPASPSALCEWCDFYQPGRGPGCAGNTLHGA